MSDDPFVFAEEKDRKGTFSGEFWKILIVDDDRDVHETTLFALRDTEIFGRGLEFHHAYSAAEGISLLEKHRDMALILLDAVMESDDSGLKAVRVIREEMKREDVRIILRTGQPGQVPELKTITEYDINDYKSKSELTRNKLLTAIIAAIRSWIQLQRLSKSRDGLEKIVQASNQFFAEQGLHQFAEGVIIQMSGLLNLEPEGIVCASEGPSSPYQIIAAAGRFSRLIDQPVSSITNPVITGAISEAMEKRKTIMGPDSLTVFFRESSGRSFAVYIASSDPLRDLDSHLMEVFCTNISLCASNIELVKRLKNQAWEDQSLHIPNMAALMEEIGRRFRAGGRDNCLLALLDITGFSQINDILGHDYGDGILKSLVQVLKERFSPGVFLSRISADIFGLVGQKRVLSSEAIENLTTIAIDTPDGIRDIGLSVGVTRFVGDGNPSSLLHNAFFALKQSKAKGQIVYYDEEIGRQTRERLLMLHDLKSALQREQLFMVYQPQARLESNDVYSFEALLRWRREDGSMIPPDRFIPLAEQSGLIIKLGEWVLRQAIGDLLRIHREGYPDMKMAVNVSAIQFRHHDFLNMLDGILEETGLDPRFLELEITESISIMSVEDILKLLQALRERGISLAVDDFGTGYSSLSSIDKWPINRIKIDKTFVQQLDTHVQGARLVDLVIPLGKKLSMSILAEGVETQDQLNRLNQLECTEIQGYFLSRPVAIDELIIWLKGRKNP